MSLSRLRCSNCPGRHFSTLLEAVQHVMSERGISRHVQCCVQGCSKRVRRLRLHIRKFHDELCPVLCSACPAKFVAQSDLTNHQRNGCPRRKLYVGSISFPEPRLVIEPSGNWLACVTSLTSVSHLGLKSKDKIGKHKAMWQEHLLDLLCFHCFLSTTVATQCTFQSSP